jgi:hypothetical protein
MAELVQQMAARRLDPRASPAQVLIQAHRLSHLLRQEARQARHQAQGVRRAARLRQDQPLWAQALPEHLRRELAASEARETVQVDRPGRARALRALDLPALGHPDQQAVIVQRAREALEAEQVAAREANQVQ